ncbi:hypothetical protein ElyMa_004434200 [Elysia marginata]|uniref:Uncharacterized protein n=1 Tax=Elysia marginata TaxID=1093978 RepID=A0AAV4HCK0_9GAST|nr:hypothetical protein ElyMa_004434200 [Elysia marginata]
MEKSPKFPNQRSSPKMNPKEIMWGKKKPALDRAASLDSVGSEFPARALRACLVLLRHCSDCTVQRSHGCRNNSIFGRGNWSYWGHWKK